MITLGEIVLIHDLKRQGLGVSAIARKLGMDRKTVRKHLEGGLAAPAYGPRPARPRLIAPYEDYLRAHITAWPDLSGKRTCLGDPPFCAASFASISGEFRISHHFKGFRKSNSSVITAI